MPARTTISFQIFCWLAMKAANSCGESPTPKAESDWGLWRQGRRVNLDAFAEAYGQPDLMKALAPFGPALRELDTASRRPGCKLAIDYREREMPGLRGFRSAARMLQVRALARLAGGDGDGALDDLFTSLRMADQFKAEPSIVVDLLRGALVAIAMQVVWEGCADHRWQARHLKAIGDELRRIDLLASARLAWEGERVGTVDTFIRMAEGLGVPRGLQDADDPPSKGKPSHLGKGWIYRNILERDRDFVAVYLDVIAPGAHRVYPERQLRYADWEAGKKYRTDLSLSAISFRAKFALVARESQLQSLVDQGAVVCALESYRLERGDYPGALGQLVPGFLPRLPWDITTGGPLHYARQDRDHFLLYSVGWDRVDQGGIPGWKEKAGKQVPDPDIEQGDWVWMRPLERP